MDKQRERLIELLAKAPEVMDCPQPHEVADFLLSHGVTVREQGEWKEVRIVRYNNGKPYTQFAHECSNCKWLNKKKKGWNTNLCPNCGAEMKKGNER